jgi:histone H3/H4
MKRKSILSLPAVITIQPRVKKIIQSDKNIGKIASNTPSVVSKATESFIEEIVKAASKIAIEQGENKVTAWHL